MVINTATACTQDCNQGRNCTCCVQCMPAEAATEVGADQDATRMWWQWLERVTPRQFWAAYATFLLACISAAYVWASYH